MSVFQTLPSYFKIMWTEIRWYPELELYTMYLSQKDEFHACVVPKKCVVCDCYLE